MQNLLYITGYSLLLMAFVACQGPEGPQGPAGAPGTSGHPVLRDGFFAYHFLGHAQDNTPLDITDTIKTCGASSLPATFLRTGANFMFVIFRSDVIGENSLSLKVNTLQDKQTITTASANFGMLKLLGNRAQKISAHAALPATGDTLTITSFSFDSVAYKVRGTFEIKGSQNTTQHPAKITCSFESSIVEIL